MEFIKSGDRTLESVEQEQLISKELDEWNFREELFKKQRSRSDWLNEGDKNTKFFHMKASYRQNINRISNLQDKDGTWIFDESGLNNLVLQHFQNIFDTSRASNFYP